MTARARHRGHPIRWAGHKWVYTSGDPVHLINGSERPCMACGRVAAKGGPDPCLGRLEGVLAACCGHGHAEDAYIAFNNRFTLRGEDALRLVRCWINHRVSPDTVLAVYQECYNLDLTEEICRAADAANYDASELIGAAMVIEQLRRNSFDFAKACGILEVERERNNQQRHATDVAVQGHPGGDRELASLDGARTGEPPNGTSRRCGVGERVPRHLRTTESPGGPDAKREEQSQPATVGRHHQ